MFENQDAIIKFIEDQQLTIVNVTKEVGDYNIHISIEKREYEEEE